MAKETVVVDIQVEMVNGFPQSTVEGDPEVFYFDADTIPEGKQGWENASVWYYWDRVTEGYKIGPGPRPKPHH